jgi:hypothetical protein
MDGLMIRLMDDLMDGLMDQFEVGTNNQPRQSIPALRNNKSGFRQALNSPSSEPQRI